MEIILKGENIHRMFKEIEISGFSYLLPNNISILNFLKKCNITYRYINSYDTNDFFNYDDMVLIPAPIENYNNLIYKELVKNYLIEENDLLTITNISNTEEDFFYFKLKYE